jgi:hypothetical protein
MAAHYAQPSLCPQDVCVYLDDVGGGKCPFRLCQSGNWWGGWARMKNFYNDHGDRSGEVPKQACAPIQECSGGYLNKVTEPRDWLSGAPIIVDMGTTFL